MKNYEIPKNFTKIEKIFRKAWLITLMILPSICTLFFLLGICYSLFNQNNIFNTKDVSNIELFSSLLFFWGLIYINYRCSYQKMGTKLLIFQLIFSVPTFVGCLILVIFRLHIITIVVFSVVSWMVLINIVMLKINQKYKALKIPLSTLTFSTNKECQK
jgi:hypothetical protein